MRKYKDYNSNPEKKYRVYYSFTGYGNFYTDASNEDEAKRNFENGNGEYENDGDEDNYEIREVEEN